MPAGTWTSATSPGCLPTCLPYFSLANVYGPFSLKTDYWALTSSSDPDGSSKEKYDERSLSIRYPEHRVRDIVPQDTLYARLLSWIPELKIPRPLDIISYLWSFICPSFGGASLNIVRRKVPHALPHELVVSSNVSIGWSLEVQIYEEAYSER